MKTTQERIALLHYRAKELQKQKEKRELTIAGSVSICLLMLLAAVIMQTNGMTECSMENQFAGASMFGESVGGYVLVAVIAFLVGAVLTILIHWYKNRNNNRKT